MENPDWKKLEILVTKIQRALAPDARVQHNIRLKGGQSEVERQIDVLVTQQIGQYELKIIIDCKDHSTPVDVKGIEEFAGIMTDVGAHKGAMVCPRGFSQAAKTRAKKLLIDLYSPVDTDPHKWQVSATAPVICKAKNMKVSFGISFSLPLPFQVPQDFYKSVDIQNDEGAILGTPKKIFADRWNSDQYPTEPGIHERIPLIANQQCFMDNGYGRIVSADLYVSIIVDEDRYFGHTPIEKLSGLKDEQTELIHTREFTIKVTSPEEIIKEWQRLEKGAPPPMNPLFEMVMIEHFDLGS